MGYCALDCEENYTCTAWGGEGTNILATDREATPNHNLIKKCPSDKSKCPYRRKKIKSTVKV
jgi:hypothetical protein